MVNPVCDVDRCPPTSNMKCILLAAGHDPAFEREIRDDVTGCHAHLEGVPKALLPSGAAGGKRILDCWWELIKSRQLFSEVRRVL